MRNIERNQNFLRKIESTNRRITETLTTSKKFDDTIETKYESKAEINRGFNTTSSLDMESVLKQLELMQKAYLQISNQFIDEQTNDQIYIKEKINTIIHDYKT